MTVLSVHCPRCMHANEDPFEVMARDEVDWMNCHGCGKKFFFLLAGCDTCVDESIFTWRNLPSPAQTRPRFAAAPVAAASH